MNRYKTFFSFVLPSVLSFALSGVYAIVDGFFIGHSMGDSGLSAINIAYPVTALIQAIGTGTGMGGAVMYSVHSAKSKTEEAENFLRGTIMYLAISGILLTVILSPLIQPVLKIMGAEGNLLLLGQDYLRIIIIGAVLQVFGTGIVPIIRNMNGSVYAMFCMIAGFLTNIVLDYTFVWVFDWGMSGAAIATIIGQGVTMAGGIGYIIHKKIVRWGLPENPGTVLSAIFRVGLAPFGTTMCPMVSLLFMNKASIIYGGEISVACYACIAYITTIIYLVLQGVGDGSQPLMSRYYGTGNVGGMKQTKKLAYITAILISLFCMGLIFIIRHEVGELFGASNIVSAAVTEALPIFLVGVPFIAFTRVTTAAFYATEKNIFSYILVYAEPVLLLLFLLILPLFWKQNGVWWSMVFSQIFTAVIALILSRSKCSYTVK